MPEYPPQYRRKRSNGLGCTCDCNYARSLQGICKIVLLCMLGLAWILIAASPYWRPIFVIGGETWPFHVVMLISVITWVAILFMYCMFMSGYHLSMPNRNWPKIELIFNLTITVMVLIAACLEAANVWRWDMSRGRVLTGNSGYSSYYQYGLRPGMSFTQTLNFNSYCAQRPSECTDFFNLLAGNNTYYTNHLFAVVLLFFSLIGCLITSYFSYRTWRIFERDMYKPGKMPKPTLWMRFQYNVENAAEKARNKMTNLVRRNNDNEDDDEGGEIDITEMKVNEKTTDLDLEAGFSHHGSSRDDGRQSQARSHRSHHSSHHSHHSHHARSERSHKHGEEGSRSSSSGRSRSSSKHSSHESHHHRHSHLSPHDEVPPSYHHDHDHHHHDDHHHIHQESEHNHEAPEKVHVVPTLQAAPQNGKKKKKNSSKKQEVEVDLSPVASVMI